MSDLTTGCCIVGGGPAGMMAGYLLARAGVDVTVLEKHADFLRDFRGDTVHPSTLATHGTSLRPARAVAPAATSDRHRDARPVRRSRRSIADITHLPTSANFIALMPQWDFLNFLRGRSQALSLLPASDETEATGLIEER